MIFGFLLGQDTAMNVNRFERTVSELQTVVLRTNSKAADNIKIKSNLFLFIDFPLVEKINHV